MTTLSTAKKAGGASGDYLHRVHGRLFTNQHPRALIREDVKGITITLAAFPNTGLFFLTAFSSPRNEHEKKRAKPSIEKRAFIVLPYCCPFPAPKQVLHTSDPFIPPPCCTACLGPGPGARTHINYYSYDTVRYNATCTFHVFVFRQLEHITRLGAC